MSKIKHEPKFYLRFCKKSFNFVDNFCVLSGSIYGRFTDANGTQYFWVCDNYTLKDGKLPIHLHNGKYWDFIHVDASHPCYKWVKSAIKQLGRIPVINNESMRHEDYSALMKANTKHKKGTGGRINNKQINQPLRWNEVTELAHWHGKGNASLVASNIR